MRGGFYYEMGLLTSIKKPRPQKTGFKYGALGIDPIQSTIDYFKSKKYK